MTVSSTTNRKTFAGDAVTTSFGTSPVVFFNSSEMTVQVVVDATGVATTLTENTGYTVSGGAGSTGTINLAGGSAPYGAPAVGTTLVLLRVLPYTQTDDFVNNDVSDAEVVEDRFDKLTMMIQQLDEVGDRAIKLSSVETTTAALTELPFDRASKYLAFNSSKELIAADGTDTFPLEIGTGDAVAIYTATTGQYVDWRKGTSASPDTTAGAVLKVHRTIQIAKPGAPDLGEECAAVYGVTSSVAAGAAQPVGVYGGAKSAYSGSTASEGDACGVYGVARFTGTGVGTAIGGFFTGRRDTSTGRATAIELTTQNYGTATTYNSTGYSSGIGAWVNCTGSADSGAGIVLGNPFGYQFDVGLAFNAQVVGGKTGGVLTSSIRDDSNSTISLDIRGKHSGGYLKFQGLPTGATTIACTQDGNTVQSDVTTAYTSVSATGSTAAAAFTLGIRIGFSTSGMVIGAGSAITNQYGFVANSTLTTATNNYGFYGDIAAGSGRWNLHMAGTAQNYLAGVTGIGIAASDTAALALAAGTTGVSSLRIPHGAAPSSPVNGDMWTTTAGLFVRINGATVGPLA